MGVVYLAEQTEPIRRRVALKLIKLGMDTKQVIARFETERQALALMNHPNVAKVLDAGATEKGRPYFVMEYVKGESITAYCDRHRLTTKERLGLFMQVCQAVQHAHQKGIIHRDIKPSNVLVAIEGDKPVPKVIDFGVAKAIEQKLTERTLFTEQGQLIGTPEYMSPEQAEMSALDIDTRTDIYSLGVLLYELLVGALPFDPTSLRRAAFAEIQRIIREEEPPKPSTRLSSMGDDSTTAAHKRRTDQSALQRQLRGDLDWITMKAMDKDRTRRYTSASDLAEDIARNLKNEPVEASPPSATYRLQKFIRRNRMAIGVTLVLAILVGSSAVLGWRTHQANRTAKQLSLRAEDLVSEGIKFLKEHEWTSARTKFDEARRLNPGNYRAIANQALAIKEKYFHRPLHERDQGDLEFALNLCEAALRMEPSSAAILNLKAVLLYSLDRLDEGEAACQSALSADPLFHHASTNLAKILALQERFGPAIEAAEAGAEINKKKGDRGQYDDGIWRVWGTLQLHLGQSDAENTLREAERIQEKDNRNGLMLARLYLTLPDKRDYVEALKKARHAAASTGLADPRFKRILAQAYLQNEAFADAAEYARAAIADRDMPSYGHLIAAIAETRLGNRQEAEAHLRQAKADWPKKFKDRDVIVTAEKGLLWFDTLAELESLRSEAERLIRSKAVQPPGDLGLKRPPS